MTVGVVLAGGLSRRMGGGDKALRPFRGGTLLSAVLARIGPQVDALAINANGERGRFAAFGLPVVPDPVVGWPGPLAGVLAAIDWAARLGQTAVLTVPCDMPDLPLDLAQRLTKVGAPAHAEGPDGIAHPVIALWPVAARAQISTLLAANQRKVAVASAALASQPVRFNDASPRAFANLNTPADLGGARR
jgi:molybdenum cofactor guanylyltransferase